METWRGGGGVRLGELGGVWAAARVGEGVVAGCVRTAGGVLVGAAGGRVGGVGGAFVRGRRLSTSSLLPYTTLFRSDKRAAPTSRR